MNDEAKEASQDVVEVVSTLQKSYDDPQFLESLYMSNLQEIYIEGREDIRLTDDNVNNMVDIISSIDKIQLERLILKSHRITSTDKIVDTFITNRNTLKVLDLSNNDITYSGCISIINSIGKPSTGLETLNLSMNSLGTDAALLLAENFEKNLDPKLRYLWLASCDFSLKGIIALTTSLALNKSLIALVLDRPLLNTYEEEGTDHLSRMISQHQALSEISLKYHKIEDKGAILIAQSLSMNTSLVYLNLECNRIGVGGAESLASYLILTNQLDSLCLSYNVIGDDGAKAMAQALEKNQSLRQLTLKTNEIGSSGLIALANGLEKNSGRLRYLSLFGNDFDDASCQEWGVLEKRLDYLEVELDVQIYVVDGTHCVAEKES